MAWTIYDSKGRPIIVRGSSIVTRRMQMTVVQARNPASENTQTYFPDAADVNSIWSCVVPTDWVPGTDIIVNAYLFQTNNAGGSPVLVMRSSIGVYTEGETNSVTNIENNVNVDKVLPQHIAVLQSRTIAGASLGADDNILWELNRLGAAAGDTIGGNVFARGTWIEYTASSTGAATATWPPHDHNVAGEGGVLTDDEHDGYSEYDEIAAPGAPAADKGRLYVKDFSGVSALYYKDEGGDEYQLGDKLWVNLPVVTGGASYWRSVLTGASVCNVYLNRIDLRPSTGNVQVYLDNVTYGQCLDYVPTGIDWSKRVLFKVRFSLANTSATTTNLLQLGRPLNPGFTEPTDKAIGVRINNLALVGHAHDGAALTTEALGNIVIQKTYELLIVSDGAGNVEWFLNGVSVGTDIGGPVGAGTNNLTVPFFGARDTAGVNGRMYIHQVDVLTI